MDDTTKRELGTPRETIRHAVEVVREAFQDDVHGPYAGELEVARRDTILRRTIILIWISVFVMPTTIWSYVYVAKRAQLTTAVYLVLAAIVAALAIRLFVRHGAFDRAYHWSMVLLVGGVFGPTGTAVVEITRGSAGDFFFAFYLIFFAFTTLFPASAKFVLVTSGAVIASYVGGRAFRSEGIVFDQRLTEDLIYLFQLTFIGLVLNRVICRLFYAELVAKAELRRARDALLAEMEVAKRIQTLLLPRAPELSAHAVGGVMLPAAEVGGDYYDVITTDEGRSFLAIGDVSGHGVTSGLTMMMARTSLLGILQANPQAPLDRLYNAVNRCIRQNLSRMSIDMYMTFALFEHVQDGCFRGVGAHPPPLIHRRANNNVEEVELNGVWLGVVDDIPGEFCPEVEIQLQQGDIMLFYTDGIIERQHQDDMFGFDRLKNSLRDFSDENVTQLLSGIIEVMEKHSDVQDDDVTLLAVRYNGSQTAN